MRSVKTEKRRKTLPVRMYNDYMWLPPETLRAKASLIVRANPDSDWLRDVAAAGATVVAKEIAGDQAAAAMLGAYVVGRLLDISKQIDQKYSVDQSGYYTASLQPMEIEGAKIFDLMKTALSFLPKKVIDLNKGFISKRDLSKRVASILPYDTKDFNLIFKRMLKYYSKELGGRDLVSIPAPIIASFLVKSYIKRVPNHIGSDGKKREWCIFSHKTNELLQCYETKQDAEEALQRMHYFKNKKAAVVNPNTGQIIKFFSSYTEAQRWVNNYHVFLDVLGAIFNDEILDYPEDIMEKTSMLMRTFADVSVEQDTIETVSQRLEQLTEFINAVLNYATKEDLALRMKGTITFYSMTEDAMRLVQNYRDNFPRDKGLMMSPAYTTTDKKLNMGGNTEPSVDIYSIEVETLSKKSGKPITEAVIKDFISFLSTTTIPEFTSFSIYLRNEAGDEIYTITVPKFQVISN